MSAWKTAQLQMLSANYGTIRFALNAFPVYTIVWTRKALFFFVKHFSWHGFETLPRYKAWKTFWKTFWTIFRQTINAISVYTIRCFDAVCRLSWEKCQLKKCKSVSSKSVRVSARKTAPLQTLSANYGRIRRAIAFSVVVARIKWKWQGNKGRNRMKIQ